MTDGVTSTNGGVTSTSDIVTSTSDGVTEPQPAQILAQSLAGDYEDVQLAATSANHEQYARLGDDANIDEYERPYTMLNRDAT